MSTLKTSITDWLKGRTFENSKDALNTFEKETNKKASIIYFSRVFSKHVEDCRETKKDKVSLFITDNLSKYKTCEESHKAYEASGENKVSLIYFSRVYTQVRKQNKSTIVTTPVAKATPKEITKTITLTGRSLGDILEIVEKETGEKFAVNDKNVSRVRKKAIAFLATKGLLAA